MKETKNSTSKVDATKRILDAPDRRDGLVYVMSVEVELAVRVALATGRPLLLRGDPGSGKSSLAAYVARQREWRYYEHVVTSRTQARDLLWAFDSVRRLADAEAVRAVKDFDYVHPGVLWWALARDSARRRGAPEGVEISDPPEQNAELNAKRSPDHAVVLIDEIDKADPDMPNGLLVPLGSNEFTVTDINTPVRTEAPLGDLDPRESRHLVVITTNEERELPEAFLRRCVVVWMPHPEPNQLIEIAEAHFETYEGGFDEADRNLAGQLANELAELRKTARKLAMRLPSTAEFLDALHACRNLGISVGSDDWDHLRSLTLIKPQRPEL
jgi:MoxR-like ATPase